MEVDTPINTSLSDTQTNPISQNNIIPISTASKESKSKKTKEPKSKRKSINKDFSAYSVKGLNPYYEDSLNDINSNLWLPTTLDWKKFNVNLPECEVKTLKKTWFSSSISENSNKENILQPYLQNFRISVNKGEKEIVKTKNIRLYPTEQQQKILKNWLDASRFFYNQTVEYLEQKDTKANFFSIRKMILDKGGDWTKNVPSTIKEKAINDCCLAVKAAKKKCKKTGIFNKVKFRSKKDDKQSMVIRVGGISKNGIFHTKLGKLKFSEDLPENLCDSRLVFQFNKWFLRVPYKTTTSSISENQGRLVALDPGVRTFITYFSEHSSGKLGQGDFKRIYRLAQEKDEIQSIIDKKLCNARKRYKLRKAQKNISFRKKCLIEELHNKSISFLVNNFDVILMPTFETSEMVLKKTRKIRSKTARAMLSYRFFQFKQKLKSKAFELGKTVLDVCESYTSKTCSWNGVVKNISGAKTIKDGKIKLDRDVNGARGIFLRALVDHPELLEIYKQFRSVRNFSLYDVGDVA
jgi:putative transposase